MGRTLLLSFKGFLVYEALMNGESCFLENDEWRQIIPQMIEDENRRGKASRLGAIIDYSGYEIARCPGFVKRTRSLVANAHASDAERKGLVESITECEKILRQYQTEIAAGVTLGRQPQECEFTGIISAEFAGPLSDYSMQGVNAAIAILEQLLTALKADLLRRTVPVVRSGQQEPHRKKSPLEIIDNLAISRAIAAGRRAGKLPGPQQPQDFETWFDRVSMTMGMLEGPAPFTA
jgi:hypothetical protein